MIESDAAKATVNVKDPPFPLFREEKDARWGKRRQLETRQRHDLGLTKPSAEGGKNPTYSPYVFF
jgi:hypothetical protein